MNENYAVLMDKIQSLQTLHEKNDCVWADFFAACKDRITKDPMFGADFLMTAYGGMFNYEEFGTLANDNEEQQRLAWAAEAYTLAKELKNQ